MQFLKLRSVLFCLTGLLLLAGCRSKQATVQSASNEIPRLRPLNVVVVTVDTLRPDHLRCYGYPNIETPSLDGIARRGVLFENAVTQTPLTPPSHASIFTGQNPNVHKVRNTGGFVLQSSSHPLARILHEQGWDTAAFVGSAVLKKMFGFNNGFDVYDDEMPIPGKRSEFREDPERKASVVVDRAIQWLERAIVAEAILSVGARLRSPHPLHASRRIRTEVQGPPVRWRDRLCRSAVGAAVRCGGSKISGGKDRHRGAIGSR